MPDCNASTLLFVAPNHLFNDLADRSLESTPQSSPKILVDEVVTDGRPWKTSRCHFNVIRSKEPAAFAS